MTVMDRAIARLDKLHEEMGCNNGVHPFDIYDRIGCIIAMLKGEDDGGDDLGTAADFLRSALDHLVDFGKIELGTPQSAALIKALSLIG